MKSSPRFVWVVEINYGREWSPTVVMATDAREGTLRRKQMERQAAILHEGDPKGPLPKYRVRKYAAVR